jgi:CheY-like chemotaxis protein
LTLLNDLLDSSKIEAGKLELESAPFSLRSMLDQITRVLAVRTGEKGLRFYCRMPDEVPDVLLGDRTRLQQVLINLAGNAIKFTERGEVEIEVRVAEGGEDRRFRLAGWGLEEPATSDSPQLIPNSQSLIPLVALEFAVRDTGIGIPPGDRERIFRPFAQADASTTRRFGGTGLGLSICSSLVGMMGGRIWVESEVGKGSTFHFTVRLPMAAELPPEPETSLDISATAPSSLRVLLVEDNPANQKLATYILEERGHSVETAGDGQHAIRLTRQNPYDVILMDVQMPGMDGLEATKAIRAHEDGRRRVPIIAMTAHALKGDRERCLAAGMDAYLSKPIDAGEMIALVESLSVGSPSVATGGVSSALSPPQEGSPPAALVFDPGLALKRCLNKRDLLRQMIAFFFKDADSFLPRVRAALQKGDLAEVGRLGHRLKGTVSHLGAEAAREAALRVEQFMIHRGEQTEAEEAVKAFERECEVLRVVLTEYQATTGRGGH